jgi:hypothetical protein
MNYWPLYCKKCVGSYFAPESPSVIGVPTLDTVLVQIQVTPCTKLPRGDLYSNVDMLEASAASIKRTASVYTHIASH